MNLLQGLSLIGKIKDINIMELLNSLIDYLIMMVINNPLQVIIGAVLIYLVFKVVNKLLKIISTVSFAIYVIYLIGHTGALQTITNLFPH